MNQEDREREIEIEMERDREKDREGKSSKAQLAKCKPQIWFCNFFHNLHVRSRRGYN